ncbi:uncharacterized protein LOC116161229 [Photinus pyralis]|uniref:uncharacterized protein LOC116161229 n=1 Tax=Photinus pyralis TaxID=7054 RepID=UPI0012671434|nr:uncharacterized protein LOC116161229 [Photinus pyralis]
MYQDSIVLQTLAVKELTERHTGDYISNIILELCNSFEIKPSQIYTITTDNGSNMIKAIKSLATSNGDLEIVEMDEDEAQDLEIDDEAQESLLNSFPDDDILNLTNLLQPQEGDPFPSHLNYHVFITGMRCAAHTLQLAVEGALSKDKSVAALILKARHIIKKLRTQTYLYMIKKQNLKKPVIDCVTRWGSTMKMLESLLDLKEFCLEMSITSSDKFENFSELEWTKVNHICQALLPAYICTKKLQREQLTLSDFYGYWLECKMETNKINSTFSNIIVSNMNVREKDLLGNNVILAAIFLDPRYKIMLDKEQCKKAKSHLKEVWYHLLMYKEAIVPSIAAESSTDTDTSAVDDFEELLKEKERQVAVRKSLHPTSIKSGGSKSVQEEQQKPIDCLLNNYECEQPRINRKSDVLKFWSMNKHSHPELYILAHIVLAFPATQKQG